MPSRSSEPVQVAQQRAPGGVDDPLPVADHEAGLGGDHHVVAPGRPRRPACRPAARRPRRRTPPPCRSASRRPRRTSPAAARACVLRGVPAPGHRAESQPRRTQPAGPDPTGLHGARASGPDRVPTHSGRRLSHTPATVPRRLLASRAGLMRLGLNLGYLVGADDARRQLRARPGTRRRSASTWCGRRRRTARTARPCWPGWPRRPTDRRRVGGDADPRPHARDDRDDRRQPRPAAAAAGSGSGSGVSGPQVSEGWHGVRFDRPLAADPGVRRHRPAGAGPQDGRVRRAHYQLPLPDGPGKALKLTIAPACASGLPIYLAAVGPKNLELAGEIADGWLAIFYRPGVRRGAARPASGRSGAGRARRWTASTWCRRSRSWSGPTRGRCADPVRAVRRPVRRRHGQPRAELLQPARGPDGLRRGGRDVQDLYLARRPRDAMAAVPYEFIDSTSLLGPEERIAERLGRVRRGRA